MGYWSFDQWRRSIGNAGISGHGIGSAGISGHGGSGTKSTPLLYWFQMLFTYMLTLLAISPAIFILWPVIIHHWFPLLRIMLGIIVSSGYCYLLGIPIITTFQLGATILLFGVILLFVGIKNGVNCISNSAHDYVKQRVIGCIGGFDISSTLLYTELSLYVPTSHIDISTALVSESLVVVINSAFVIFEILIRWFGLGNIGIGINIIGLLISIGSYSRMRKLSYHDFDCNHDTPSTLSSFITMALLLPLHVTALFIGTIMFFPVVGLLIGTALLVKFLGTITPLVSRIINCVMPMIVLFVNPVYSIWNKIQLAYLYLVIFTKRKRRVLSSPRPPPEVVTPPKRHPKRRRRLLSPMYMIKRVVLLVVLCAHSVYAMPSPRKPAPKTDREGQPVNRHVEGHVEENVEETRQELEVSSPFQGSNVDVGSGNALEIEFGRLFGRWGNKQVIAAAKNLLNTEDDGSIRSTIKQYLVGCLVCNDESALRKTFEDRQKELGNKINNVKLGRDIIKSRRENKEESKHGSKKNWESNLGEGLNDSTEGLGMANYAPTSDNPLQDGKYCRLSRTNPCMRKFCQDLINSLIKELDRYLGEDGPCGINLKPGGHNGMRLVDACCIVLGKDDYQREIRAFLKAAELTKYEFYAVAMITIGYHAKYYALKNNNQPLPFLPTTANGRDNVLDYDAINFNNQGFCNFACIKIFQCVPHGECWGRKTYLLQYGVKAMVDIGRSFVGFYSCFEDLHRLSELANYTDEDVHRDLSTIEEGVRVVGSVIAFRYSGIISMTQEERDALVKGKLFFYRCGTLASFLFGKGTEGLEDNIEMATLFEEMLDFVGGDSDSFAEMLSAKYDSMVKGGSWGTLATALFGGDGVDKTRADLVDGSDMANLYDELLEESGGDDADLMKRLRDKYDSMVKGGSWGTLASALFGGDGDDKTRDDLVNGSDMANLYDELLEESGDDDADLMKRLKDKYDSLVLGGEKGGEKGGSWAKLASAFAGTCPQFTRSELNSDMETLYASLLSEYIRENGDVDEHDFIKYLKDKYNSFVSHGKSMGKSMFENRRGIFKWMDDFGDLLQSVLMSEEDVPISAEDKEKFAMFEHTLAAAQALKDFLEKGVLPEASVPGAFKEINDALAEGTDDPSLLIDPQVCMDQRWRRFLTRFSDISGVDELQAYRGRKIGDRLQVSADNKGSTALDNTEKVLSNTGQVTKSSKATKLSADNLMS